MDTVISPYLNCVQTNLFTPYLCHVNLLSLIMFKTNQPKETMQKTTYDLEEAIFHTEEDFDLIPHKEKTNQPKETMNTLQLKNITISSTKTDRLFREIRDCDNQWFAMSKILDFLHEDQKVEVRKYIRELIKEEKSPENAERLGY